jgi:putative salt-induced outer membrane protein YdiY
MMWADEVTLVNGDRVTGTVVKQDGKNITVKTELFGTVTMPWSKVKTLHTDNPVHVVLSGGETVRGKIETREDQLEIAEETLSRKATFSEISALRNAAEQRMYERLLEPSWTQLWAGTATLGFAGTTGNAETRTLTMGMNAARVTRVDKATVQLNAIRSSAMFEEGDELTAQAVRGGWGYSRNVSNRISLNTFNDYEYDRFQNLDLRFVLGAGAGITVWKAERSRLELLAGGAYNRESFSESETQDAFVRDSGEAYVGNEFTYKLTAVTAISQNFRFFSNMTDLGRFRFNGDLGANTKLAQWLSWNVAFSNRYLSLPVTGRQKNDFLYTTGIGVTFAR